MAFLGPCRFSLVLVILNREGDLLFWFSVQNLTVCWEQIICDAIIVLIEGHDCQNVDVDRLSPPGSFGEWFT